MVDPISLGAGLLSILGFGGAGATAAGLTGIAAEAGLGLAGSSLLGGALKGGGPSGATPTPPAPPATAAPAVQQPVGSSSSLKPQRAPSFLSAAAAPTQQNTSTKSLLGS